MGLGKTVVTIALILKRPWSGPTAAEAEAKAESEGGAAAEEGSSVAAAAAGADAAGVAVKEERDEEMKESDETPAAAAAAVVKTDPDAFPAPAPAAAAMRTPERVGATLIVSPVSLLYQWDKEIRLHAPTLRVHIYGGLERGQTSAEGAAAYGAALAAFRGADVVLATYATLGAEVNYSRACRHALRGAKRYAVPQSPLLDVRFHRAVLDEAQQVHSAAGVLFRMASRLSCGARWCVSGTPIGPQGLADLYGLVSFLGVRPFDSAAVWRAAMRPDTPDGLARLKHLLRQIMWRHSKAHVLDECSIPALRLNKVNLSFTKVELEYYRHLERECQSRVYFEAGRGALEDRTALKKLDALRQACAHPQASSGTFLGAAVRPLPEIGRLLIRKAADDATRCERDLCRALNRLALELRRQGRTDQAEAAFKTSWKISDSGLFAEDAAGAGAAGHGQAHDAAAVSDRPAKRGATATGTGTGDSPSKGGKARGSYASGGSSSAASSKKMMDNFESDVNIVTANAQVREWRAIDLVITSNLAALYSQRLEAEYGARPPGPGLSRGDETCEEVFARVMREAATLEPEPEDASHAVLADRIVQAFNAVLPPQLANAAAASASASASSSSSGAAAADAEADATAAASPPDRRAQLVQAYERQREQYEYSLHDMLDLFELRLADEAVLIAVTYEKDLLPKAVASAVEEVRALYEERARVGVDKFNSAQQPYMGRVAALEEELAARQRVPAEVLTLYDLHRSRLLLGELQAQLLVQPVRANKARLLEELASHPRFLRIRRALGLGPPVKHKAQSSSRKASNAAAAASAEGGKKAAAKQQRTFEERLARSDQQLRAAITKREKALGAAWVERLRGEDDMRHAEPMEAPGVRAHRARYDAEWRGLRDSIQALSIMREVRDQRRKMRAYTAKLLDHKCAVLVEAGVITAADAERWSLRRAQELRNRDGPDADAAAEPQEEKPKPSPKKKAKLGPGGAAAAGAAERSDSAGSDRSDASAAAAAFPSSSFAGHSIAASSSSLQAQSQPCPSECDAAVDIEALRDAAVRRLESDVTALRRKATAAQTMVTVRHSAGLAHLLLCCTHAFIGKTKEKEGNKCHGSSTDHPASLFLLLLFLASFPLFPLFL